MSYKDDYYRLLNSYINNTIINTESNELRFFEKTLSSNKAEINHYEVNPFSSDYLTNILFKYYLNNNSFSKKYIFPDISENINPFGCNNVFPYKILHPVNSKPAKDIIILMHGLNERDWSKYLTWACRLQKQTNKSVVLFPLSFHMERAPKEWGESRAMFQLSKERTNLITNLNFSTYANAALSTRLNFEPERFFLSGIQSYFDIIQFVEEIQSGKNELIDKNAHIDFVGYSAGAFLGELLLMVNHKNLFSDSRLLLLCGGSVLEETYPVSKAILDSESVKVLKGYYIIDFEKKLSKNEYLTNIFSKYEDIGIIFKSMLSTNKMNNLRNSLIKGLNNRLFVIALEKDNVFRVSGIKETFKNLDKRSIKIIDFDYNYTHEKPFPEKSIYEEQITIGFDKFFNLAANFLK
ncbi:MAG: DUF6051 family protein [bacterium]